MDRDDSYVTKLSWQRAQPRLVQQSQSSPSRKIMTWRWIYHVFIAMGRNWERQNVLISMCTMDILCIYSHRSKSRMPTCIKIHVHGGYSMDIYTKHVFRLALYTCTWFTGLLDDQIIWSYNWSDLISLYVLAEHDLVDLRRIQSRIWYPVR